MSIVPIADAGDGGDYLTTGGCGPTDGGARCHPWCTPGAAGDAGTDAGCCLDDECASGQCFGAPTNRRCVSAAQRATINQACGDETDCFNTGIACDVRRLSCSDTILSSLGDADAGTRCFLGGSSTSCSLLPDISDYYCALPGQTPGQAGNPCCYDRTDAGIWVTCLLTGNCYCTMDMGCGSNAGARCPF